MVDKEGVRTAPLLNPENKTKCRPDSQSCVKFTWLEGSPIVVKVSLRVSRVFPHLVRISAPARSNSIIWEVAEEIELGDKRKIGLTTSHQLPLIFCSNNSIPIDLYWTFGVLGIWNKSDDKMTKIISPWSQLTLFLLFFSSSWFPMNSRSIRHDLWSVTCWASVLTYFNLLGGGVRLLISIISLSGRCNPLSRGNLWREEQYNEITDYVYVTTFLTLAH